MSEGLTDKRALVTAAGQGIGWAIATRFAAAGAQVVAVELDASGVERLGEVDGIEARQQDVTDSAGFARLVADAGADVLVNVAGFVHHGSILDCDAEALEFSWRLNTQSMHTSCRAALPGMVERGDGCIVNIASVASSLKGVPTRFAYSTTKAACLGLTKSIAADFVKQGVRANCICPGTVRSPSWEQRVRSMAERDGIAEDEAVARFVARQPMGRVGEADEVAALAQFLAGDDARFITGQELCVDGGWSTL